MSAIEHDRSQYIGGSDAAAILGLSPWSTPVELFMEKTWRSPPKLPDRAQAKRFARGHKLEPFILEMTVDRLEEEGHDVVLLAKNGRYFDPEFPFMTCEIDAELLVDGEVMNMDAKSVSGFARKKWGEGVEDIPIEYACQGAHGLMITRRLDLLAGKPPRKKTIFAALRSFDEVDLYEFNHDEESEKTMREKEVLFWTEHVLEGVPPDPMVFSDIKALFPLDDGSEIEATEDIAEKVGQFKEIKDRIKLFTEAKDELQFEIAEFISPHAWLTHQGERIMSWKGQRTSHLNIDALREAWPDIAEEFTVRSTTRALRNVKAKKGRFR